MAAALTTTDIFDASGKRVGVVREGPGGQVDIYDKESKRIGWGRCDPRGRCELFDRDGRRIGESRDGRIIIDPARLERKGGKP